MVHTNRTHWVCENMAIMLFITSSRVDLNRTRSAPKPNLERFHPNRIAKAKQYLYLRLYIPTYASIKYTYTNRKSTHSILGFTYPHFCWFFGAQKERHWHWILLNNSSSFFYLASQCVCGVRFGVGFSCVGCKGGCTFQSQCQMY